MGGKHFRGYFFKEGYIRTSSSKFTLSDFGDRETHLTNDAVQGKSEKYGQYEAGNKISQSDFAQFLMKQKNAEFSKIIAKIKKIIKQTLIAFWQSLQTQISTSNQFEIFGYDFMLDENLKVYLIEVNTNPCLDTTPCALL